MREHSVHQERDIPLPNDLHTTIAFLQYLQTEASPKTTEINKQLATLGVMVPAKTQRTHSTLVSLSHRLKKEIDKQYLLVPQDQALGTANILMALDDYVHQLHNPTASTELAVWQTQHVVDFTSRKLEILTRPSETSFERTFSVRQEQVDTIVHNDAIPYEQKLKQVAEIVEAFFGHAQNMTSLLSQKIIETATRWQPAVKTVWSHHKKLLLTIAVTSALLVGKPDKNHTDAHSLRALVASWTELRSQPQTQETVATLVEKQVKHSETANNEHPVHAKKHATPKVQTSPKEERKSTIIEPLPTKSPTTLTPMTVAGVKLFKDPVSDVHYRKVQKNKTIGEVRNTLKQDNAFSYLNGKWYKPSNNGNVSSRNIQANRIAPGQLVPIPLDKEVTQLTDSELRTTAQQALSEIQKDEHYWSFVRHLQEELWEDHLVTLMMAFAKKESNQWATSVYRFEPTYETYSYSIYHILTEKSADWKAGPGLRALYTLGFTPGEVMEDATKAGQRFRGYRCEKWGECKHMEAYEKYADHPEKLFAKKHIPLLGKIYNGTKEYGKALRTVFGDIED